MELSYLLRLPESRGQIKKKTEKFLTKSIKHTILPGSIRAKGFFFQVGVGTSSIERLRFWNLHVEWNEGSCTPEKSRYQ